LGQWSIGMPVEHPGFRGEDDLKHPSAPYAS
jgi:hypothetical protein